MIRRKGTFGGKRLVESAAQSLPVPVELVMPEKHKPGKDELYLRDAEYNAVYVTVPTTFGCDGVSPSLRPQPHTIKLFEKSVPRVTYEQVPDKAANQVAPTKSRVEIAKGITPVKMIRREVKTPTDNHRIIVYNEYSREWFDMLCSGDTVISTDLSRIPAPRKPRDPQNAVVGKPVRRSEGGFKRTKPIPASVPASGQKVIIVTIGVKKGLYDIGDGSHVVDIPIGVKAANAAKQAKRTLVTRVECGEYAMHVLVEKWKEGRRMIKGIEKRSK